MHIWGCHSKILAIYLLNNVTFVIAMAPSDKICLSLPLS